MECNRFLGDNTEIFSQRSRWGRLNAGKYKRLGNAKIYLKPVFTSHLKKKKHVYACVSALHCTYYSYLYTVKTISPVELSIEFLSIVFELAWFFFFWTNVFPRRLALLRPGTICGYNFVFQYQVPNYDCTQFVIFRKLVFVNVFTYKCTKYVYLYHVFIVYLCCASASFVPRLFSPCHRCLSLVCRGTFMAQRICYHRIRTQFVVRVVITRFRNVAYTCAV